MKRVALFLILLLLFLFIYSELHFVHNDILAMYKDIKLVNEDGTDTRKNSKGELPQKEKSPAPIKEEPDPLLKKETSPLEKVENHSQTRFTGGPVEKNENGDLVVGKPSGTLALVNKERALPANYVPSDLVIPDIPFAFSQDLPKKKIRKEAARALEDLFAQAKEDKIKLAAVSGYRSYQRQKVIFNYNVKRKGREAASKVSAYPGHSEHQAGLAMDVSSPSVNYRLTQEFGETKEGKWLARVAPKYGFIIRYPQGQSGTTGYKYEPWHIRYVGVKHAMEIAQKRLTLEEYLYS